MTTTEIDEILSGLLRPETAPFEPPSLQDWEHLERRFECRFSDEFKAFMALISRFQFPGDILNVSSGRNNGNDRIELTYDLESETGNWNADMVPFYAIGNGDYFCLHRGQCPSSPVYYRYADRLSYERYCDSIEDWIKQLPEFLA